jgi:hypothetical protein
MKGCVPQQISFNSESIKYKLALFCVDSTWNDPDAPNKGVTAGLNENILKGQLGILKIHTKCDQEVQRQVL